jgi:hypothetical protein
LEMQSLVCRAYVIGYSNAAEHRLYGAPLLANIRLSTGDESFSNIPTDIKLASLASIGCETMPRCFAFDVGFDGQITMRLPTHQESFGARPASAKGDFDTLRWKLRSRDRTRPLASRPRTSTQFPQAAMAA